MGNRVQNYLNDLVYALDYAYTTCCSTLPSVCDGQNSRLTNAGSTSWADTTTEGKQRAACCVCETTHLHNNDLITAVLNLRNPKNQTCVIAECMRSTVKAYNCDGELITGCIVQISSGQAKVPGTGVCTACGYYTACGVTGTPRGNATHNCGTLTVSLPKGYYEGASVCVLGSCNRTTPPTYGACVMVDGASQYPYSSGYLVASGDGTVMSASNTYYARHNYGDVAIKIPEGYYPDGYTTHMKGAELRTPSNVAATSAKQGYVCIPAGYTSGFTCCWNMAGTSFIGEADVASGYKYVDATGCIRTGTYTKPRCNIGGCVVVTTTAKCYLVDSICLGICIYDCYNHYYTRCYITGNIVAMCVCKSEGEEGYLYAKFRYYGTSYGANCTFEYKYGYYACIYDSFGAYKYLNNHFVELNALSGILYSSW